MTMQFFEAAETARLTPFPALVDALAQACLEAARAEIASPARLVVPLNQGGTMLCMPAAARDLGGPATVILPARALVGRRRDSQQGTHAVSGHGRVPAL